MWADLEGSASGKDEEIKREGQKADEKTKTKNKRAR